MRIRSRQRGMSLIEVLMAVLIFSIGLIGMAGLLVMATRSNHAAYLRTQAVFLADSMADRMSANSVGVWSGSYNASNYPVSTSAGNCSTGCTPDALAQFDQSAWSSELRTFLPGVSASIHCDASSAGFTPDPWAPPSSSPGGSAATPGQIGMRPPYGGTCNMHIRWQEQGIGSKDNRGASPQNFYWEFQP
jgi:type IV pilus assembly protein PilV